MGMTYVIKAKNEQGEHVSLTDDMVFDRECLGYWMKLTEDDWEFYRRYGHFVITADHAKLALDTLTALVDKVKSMPFTEDQPACKNYIGYDPETNDSKYEYVGSPENIAILKEVEEVLNREYHFNYPWDEYVVKGECEMGVPYMIEALNDVIKYAEANPAHQLVVLYC